MRRTAIQTGWSADQGNAAAMPCVARTRGFLFLKGMIIMKKTPFITLEKAREIAQEIPTPFHVYDEAGIRANARALKQAFSWNKGFKEYFAAAIALPIPNCCWQRAWESPATM